MIRAILAAAIGATLICAAPALLESTAAFEAPAVQQLVDQATGDDDAVTQSRSDRFHGSRQATKTSWAQGRSGR
jgi:hypothetical protein